MEKLFRGIYTGKKVFVTGHTGFKGSWLTLWLNSLGANVVGYSLPPVEPGLFIAAKLENQVTHIIGDVRDSTNIFNAIHEHKPDMIFHLAAQPLVRLSYKEPRTTFETNIMGTVNILEAIRHVESVRTCVIVTSDKCYDNKEWSYAYRENDPLGGNDPYSASKACAELVVNAYRHSFFPNSNDKCETALSSVRAGNVIGGGDWAKDRIVPDAISAIVQDKKVPVRNPNAIRSWQHVLDPLSGYLWLASLMWHDGIKYSSAWNFGPDNTGNITVSDLVKMIIANWRSGSWLDLSATSICGPHEANILRLDCTRANNLLHWYPVYDVTEAVKFTTDWYRHYYLNKNTDILSFTMKQIEDYINKARINGLVWSK